MDRQPLEADTVCGNSYLSGADPALGSVEKKGEEMTSEIKRYAAKALYWIILAATLIARGFLAYFDFKTKLPF